MSSPPWNTSKKSPKNLGASSSEFQLSAWKKGTNSCRCFVQNPGREYSVSCFTSQGHPVLNEGLAGIVEKQESFTDSHGVFAVITGIASLMGALKLAPSL